MAVTARRERYTVDLIGLQAACEANFARLMRLLPDTELLDRATLEQLVNPAPTCEA